MYQVNPKAKVMGAVQKNESTIYTVVFDREVTGPIAPAGLYAEGNAEPEIELHRLLSNSGNTYVFETFRQKPNTKSINRTYSYTGWWVDQAIDAVNDNEAHWEKLEYPSDGSHQHCLFTWDTISAYQGHKYGWYSKKYGWVTEKAYKDFIIDDIYRIRG